MAETEFAIAYDGPVLADGRMEVRDLAPALLALGDLFAEASLVVAPTRSPVALQIRATAQGSFDVHLILKTAEEVWSGIADLFAGDDATALVNLKELVIGSGVGLFWLVKRLRRRRVVAEQAVQPGTVRLTLDDATTLEIPAQTLTLYRNVRVRRATRAVIQPVRRDGIDRVQFIQDSEVTVSVDDDDAEAFEIPVAEDVPLVDRTVEMAVSLASVAFVEGNKWRLSDGERTFYASMEDVAFLERVDRGEEAFRKGDILRCEMRIQQVQRDGALHTDYSVVRVLAHIPASAPVQLAFESDGSDDEQ